LNSKNTVLYFALGECYVKQAVLSLVSLLSVYGKGRPGFGIIVLTDMPERFAWLKTRLPLDARLLTREQLPELSGPHGFVLRAKIAVMAQLHSETKGNLLFIDTDTILRGRLEKIFRRMEAGECFLHKREWPLSKGRKLHPELCPRDLEFKLESGTEIKIDDGTQMWNSGVVGIPESGGKLLHDALDLCDKYYEFFPGWHVEQFSLSIILQETGRLRRCRREVFHYWHNKELAASFIKKALPYYTSKTISSLEVEKFVWEARIRFYVHRLRVVTRKNKILYKLFLCIRKH
jgi:hypothetical protein